MAQSDSQKKTRLYFAYGSNLSTTQMQNRCPSSTPMGLAHLQGWTWIINRRGYANIVINRHQPVSHDHKPEEKTQASDDSFREQPPNTTAGPGVYGLMYQLNPEDEKRLDMYEGVGYAYERVMLEVVWAAVPDANNGHGASPSATNPSFRPDPLLPGDVSEHQAHEQATSRMPGKKVEALVYVDFRNITPSTPKREYVGRMNVGIQEASGKWGLPHSYIDKVMRPYIPLRASATR
ncbi:hypothetical protein F4808DRAFT_463571 [Astrocystis sublimbata]|nr:hypothetical protein F4808DRAFT_468855 [Astrocystis sublimbata]KAI0193524.1 hypothetical protein F4808DRAFT_464773 [Astrocystis sublimbata]KAI0197704.1 hypothetical protein F4808DRAFT_463571 [Astrocystis sublimbata]